MEVAREPHYRVEKAPHGSDWRHGSGEIRSCGDRITLHIRLLEDQVVEARYEGIGCALALASAELLCRALLGLSQEAAKARVAAWQAYLAGDAETPEFSEQAARPGGTDRSGGTSGPNGMDRGEETPGPGEAASTDCLDSLEPLALVRSYPARKSCVLLAFDCAREAFASD